MGYTIVCICHVHVYNNIYMYIHIQYIVYVYACVINAHAAIESYAELEGGEGEEEGEGWKEGGDVVKKRLNSLERVLKSLENVSWDQKRLHIMEA